MPRTDPFQETTCLTRTCLHWTPDGELSADDKQLVLRQLLEGERCHPDAGRSRRLA